MSRPACSLDYCDKPSHARGWCSTHYRQWHQGRPLAPVVKLPELCAFDGCGRARYARGYCIAHYYQLREGKQLQEVFEPKLDCDFPGCERQHCARGYCKGHYSQLRRGLPLTGEIGRPKPKPCLFDGCEKRARRQGYCDGHGAQIARGEKPRELRRQVEGGAWRKQPNGYVMRRISENGEKRSIAQHRWVMEKHIGRKILPHENIHHKNGDRADNRIENLEIWNTSQPAGQRPEDKVAWAKELLALYEPEALANRRTLRAA